MGLCSGRVRAMGIHAYYTEVIHRAFRGKFWLAEKISGGFALFFGLLVLADPEWAGFVTWVPVAVFAAVFVGTIIAGLLIAHHAMWQEGQERIGELERALLAAEEAARPKISIEGLRQKPRDPSKTWFLVVKNVSNSNGISGYLARIEEVTDSNGDIILSHEVLRTDNQVDGRSDWRFNLDPLQEQLIPICESVATSGYSFRMIMARLSRKIEVGEYWALIRVTTNEGRPVQTVVKISQFTVNLEEAPNPT
jgi:hypothetical protein